jgi:hypothetical protein
VWIDHLRRHTPGLARQLEQGQVACHPFVIGEVALACDWRGRLTMARNEPRRSSRLPRRPDMETRVLLALAMAIALTTAGTNAPLAGLASSGLAAQAPATQSAGSAERTALYFYRVKWGFQDEFIDLFQKNHYPILKAQLGTRITAVRAYVPTYHGDGRADWTFAVAITYKDTAAMTGPSSEAEIARKLYPDQEKFRREEQRRFEILDAHWDVPLNELALDTRVPTTK